MGRCVILPLFCLGVFAFSAPARAQSEPSTVTATPSDSPAARARTHYARGLSFYTQREYARALAEFERAYALVPSPRLLFSMGQAHAGLGQYAAAFKELQAYVASVGSSVPAERRSQVTRQLEALRAQLGSVAVTVNVPGTSIDVDGEVVGSSPLRAPVMLDPGSHRVGAAHTDHSPASARVSVISGEVTAVRFDLQPSAEMARPSLAKPFWIATGVCAALAIGSGIIAFNYHSDYEQDVKQAQPGDPADVHDDLESQRSRLQGWLVATDILAAMTALTGVTAVYFSVHEAAGSERTGSSGKVGLVGGMSGSF